jgi:tetratricopeptide (TPR) repeat protein
MLKALVQARQEKLKEAIDDFIKLLGKDRYNRYLNINLGLIYSKAGNKLLAAKYFVIGASSLEKSDGLYKISEVFNMAVEYFDNNSYRKSMTLFKIVVSEQDHIEAWQYIGDICFKMNNITGAIKAYRKIVSINPQSDIGDEKLKAVHDFYYEKGLVNIEEQKSRIAAEYFKKALNVVEIADTFEKAIKLYIKIKDHEEVQELQKRYDQIKQKDKDILHKELKIRAQKYLKIKKFEKATECYEKAFEMKIDKDVFMYLAYIYKTMKKKEKLAGLMKRWEKMLDDEEKRKQRERTAVRSKKVFI